MTKEAVSLDCEFVETSEGEPVAQVCVVKADLTALLKTYVLPQWRVTDYRTEFSGITRRDLMGAPALSEVRPQTQELLRGHLLVGHSVRKDLELLGISHPAQDIRDTSNLPRFLDRNGRRRKLKDIALEFSAARIQEASHDPEEDARAAMMLFLCHWNLQGAAPEVKLICRNCQAAGHKASQCPQVVCYRCGCKGHMQSTCPARDDDDDVLDEYCYEP